MDILEKARILSSAGKYDSCGPKMCEVNIRKGLNICYAKAEHKTCRIFKTLMTNSCKMDCKYCENSCSGARRKEEYSPDELAYIFDYLHTSLNVNGLFLSSGFSDDPDIVTEKMIDAVKLIRNKHSFRGYIHFKVLPGTSYDLIRRAAKLVDRMSINIEAPNSSVMKELSSCKDFRVDILRRQKWIAKCISKSKSLSQVTQVMVTRHASDEEIMKIMLKQYDSGLKRVYYSAFRPVQGTAMEKEKAEPLSRQNHLYNVDFLLRKYDYKIQDFRGILEEGMLPDEDPKLAIAKANFESPVDINEASYEELIRIPGIGITTARRILSYRKTDKKITRYEEILNLGAVVKKAKPFIVVDGKRQKMLSEF